ncbi:hypothetical protein HK405_014943, partial [Cladochytrium tenue]
MANNGPKTVCTGGELFTRLCARGSFYEDDAAELVRTVVDAVAFLHSQNIVHRDIKAENLLFRTPAVDADLVIADFGLSQVIDPTIDEITTSGGTLEVLLRQRHGTEVDLWSIGVLTYYILCGYPPFPVRALGGDVRPILEGRFAFEPPDYWMDVSNE